jgi:hypothetical protein
MTVRRAKRLAAVTWATFVVIWTCSRACPAEECCPYGTDCGKPRLADEECIGYRDPGVVFWCEPPAPDYWTIDFRVRTFCSSMTSYEIGTAPEDPAQWAPLSRLNFSLNSVWYGLQLAHETPKWGFRFEWLMAGQYIDGGLADFDWVPDHEGDVPVDPGSDATFSHLGFTRERFTEGQMLDIEYKYKLFEPPANLPVEVWPLVGFRWQRLDVTAFDLSQVRFGNVWLDPPETYEGDVITFNQQYCIGYAGVQLRGRLAIPNLPPLVWTLQGDWGYTEAYNVDHHLVREGDMFSMNRTAGNCWHAALTVEAVVTARIGVGVQADQLYIQTVGEHRWLNEPLGIDETWSNGVTVSSRQTWITAFLRIRM